ncbi:hypothetical protein Ddye_019543 [Dipteronia dyeriana]|uniref:Peptidyl-prolyl cis-trans isomerase n=1 Tax=Dipteronia dyeriana TaxID=168575 RepID=A0AAD9TZ04_9ROSI|nr:hypothetical protein Ddye_019543 [Dipteronia dyeriana]
MFFELSIDSHPMGRLVIRLFADSIPITTKNFWALCTGEKGIDNIRKPLHYKGKPFHCMMTGFMFQVGYFINRNRAGGKSIYDASFTDENFVNQPIGPGILSIANTGSGMKGSQFFICTSKTEWLDGKHVDFGQIVERFNVMKVVEMVGSRSGKTTKTIMVSDCGKLS